MGAEAAHGFCGLVLEACDGGLASGNAQTLAPASDIGGVGRAGSRPNDHARPSARAHRSRTRLFRTGIDRRRYPLLGLLLPFAFPVSIVMYGRPPLGKDFLAFRQTNRQRSCIRPLNAAFDRGP